MKKRLHLLVVNMILFSCAALEIRPVVYAVGNNYQICIPTEKPATMWCKTADKIYQDSINGVLASRPGVRKIEIPQQELDRTKQYTIGYREITARRPYFSQTGKWEEKTFSFRPVTSKTTLRFFFLSDVHQRDQHAIKAGKYFGDKLDFLVLGGDLSNDAAHIDSLTRAHHLAWNITRGECPVVYVRGNHEQWGEYGEAIPNYLPSDRGKSHYSFRLGPVWGVVLDTGMDKPDDHREFAHTAAGSSYRREVSQFLETIAAHPDTEFRAPDVHWKLLFCHSPFPIRFNAPYNVDQHLYPHWAKLLRETIRPQLMVFGHLHRCFVASPGSEQDFFKTDTPFVCGGLPRDDSYIGTAVTMTPETTTVAYVDQNHHVYQTSVLQNKTSKNSAWHIPDTAESSQNFQKFKFRLLDLGKDKGECVFEGGDNAFQMTLANTSRQNDAIACADFNKIASSNQELVFELKGAPDNAGAHVAVTLLHVEGGNWIGGSINGIVCDKSEFQEIRLPLEKAFHFTAGNHEFVQLKFSFGGGRQGTTSRVQIREIRLVNPVAK